MRYAFTQAPEGRGGGGVRDTDIDRDRVSIYILIFLGWVNRGRYDLFPVPLKV